MDRETGEHVAVKLCQSKALEKNAWTRICPEEPMEEVRSLRALQDAAGGAHPNVVRLLDTFEHSGFFWIVLEFCEGGELFEDIMERAKTGAINHAHNLALVEQMARGLAIVHAVDIAHLDVSLENYLIAADGTVKLCDFGLAQEVHLPLTAPRGKALYMAPEVALPKLQETVEDYDPRSADVFSLGICLFMMSAGFRPFEKPSVKDSRFVFLLKHGPRALLEKFNIHVPEAVLEILDMTLTLPKGRSNLREVLGALLQRVRHSQRGDRT